MIETSVDQSLINRALVDKVYDRVFEDLEDNFLSLMPIELEGMVWYLTANCYIHWD